MKKAIGIVRVSGREQKYHYGPDAQEADIRQRSAELKIDLVELWTYQESATKSGIEVTPVFGMRVIATPSITDGGTNTLGLQGQVNFRENAKVPLLSSIPLVYNLFSKRDTDASLQLVILVRPRIIIPQE